MFLVGGMSCPVLQSNFFISKATPATLTLPPALFCLCSRVLVAIYYYFTTLYPFFAASASTDSVMALPRSSPAVSPSSFIFWLIYS